MAAFARALALSVAAVVTLHNAASAQTVADTVSRWGLLGTWAIDCSKPVSGGNGYLSYVIRSPGKVSHERDFGDRQDVNEVQQARTGVGGMLELVVQFPRLQQTRIFTLHMGPDGRTRAMSNSKIDGSEQSIKDGLFTSNGNPSPWQTRCR